MNGGGKEGIFPHGARHKWSAIGFGEGVIFVQIGRATNNAPSIGHSLIPSLRTIQT